MRINPTDTQCKFTDDIPNFKNNALTKIWIQESVHLSNNEEGMLEGLQTSPIAFGFISAKTCSVILEVRHMGPGFVPMNSKRHMVHHYVRL